MVELLIKSISVAHVILHYILSVDFYKHLSPKQPKLFKEGMAGHPLVNLGEIRMFCISVTSLRVGVKLQGPDDL